MLIFIICIIILFTHVDRWNIRNIPTRKKNISHANDGGHAPRRPAPWIRPCTTLVFVLTLLHCTVVATTTGTAVWTDNAAAMLSASRLPVV